MAEPTMINAKTYHHIVESYQGDEMLMAFKVEWELWTKAVLHGSLRNTYTLYR